MQVSGPWLARSLEHWLGLTWAHLACWSAPLWVRMWERLAPWLARLLRQTSWITGGPYAYVCTQQAQMQFYEQQGRA